MDYNEYIGTLRKVPTSEVYPDSGIRWTPHSLSVPEQIAYAKGGLSSEIDSLTFWHRNSGGYDFQSLGKLKAVAFPVLETLTGDLNFNATSLTSFSAPHLACPHDTDIILSNTDLSVADVDALYNRLAIGLDGTTTYTAVVNTSGSTGNASAASSAARVTLAAAGVTCTT